jgi:hypothetical protein
MLSMSGQNQHDSSYIPLKDVAGAVWFSGQLLLFPKEQKGSEGFAEGLTGKCASFYLFM